MNPRRWINNWELVDTSAPYILGDYLWDKPREVLYELAKSRVLWDRRIAILSTFYFIRQKDFDDTLMLAKQFLNDDEDLMHKAVGWMLREIGKRHFKTTEQFIKQYHKSMPRTMLHYTLEKFPDTKRKRYMKK